MRIAFGICGIKMRTCLYHNNKDHNPPYNHQNVVHHFGTHHVTTAAAATSTTVAQAASAASAAAECRTLAWSTRRQGRSSRAEQDRHASQHREPQKERSCGRENKLNFPLVISALVLVSLFHERVWGGTST